MYWEVKQIKGATREDPTIWKIKKCDTEENGKGIKRMAMWMKITIKQQKYRREHHNSVDIKA